MRRLKPRGRPLWGDNYLYLYCLWVDGSEKGKGYGKALMEYCIADAKQRGRSGVCMLGSKRQKHWLADQAFAKAFGFRAADETHNGYELLALSFDGTAPRFAPSAKRMQIERDELTIYYDRQCPFIDKSIEIVRQYCEANAVAVTFVEVNTLKMAKELPCVFNNWCVFYHGQFETVNLLLDEKSIERIVKK